jgi:hypothetical protein
MGHVCERLTVLMPEDSPSHMDPTALQIILGYNHSPKDCLKYFRWDETIPGQ